MVAEQFCCVAALLETVIRQLGRGDLGQRQIAESLGVWVPEDYAGPLQHVHRTPDQGKWGIRIRDDDLNRFFGRSGIPLRESFMAVSTIPEYELLSLLERELKAGCHIICGYDYDVLHGRQSVGVGHVGLAVGTTSAVRT